MGQTTKLPDDLLQLHVDLLQLLARLDDAGEIVAAAHAQMAVESLSASVPDQGI
ncbi:hypothetical protein [Novosphingobium sp. B 225]|uniref:hypothetical protein n=1 Tax=Novosphingobium sp. B 225 TaxID=1961849 RepID=UPI0015954B0D|nr:hypothetical protein [Novosphingobium sp. B 225]